MFGFDLAVEETADTTESLGRVAQSPHDASLMAHGNLLTSSFFDGDWQPAPGQTAYQTEQADGSYLLLSRNGGAESALRLDLAPPGTPEDAPEPSLAAALFDDTVFAEDSPLDIRGLSLGEQLDFSVFDEGDAATVAAAVKLVDLGSEATGVLYGGILVALIWAVESRHLSVQGTKVRYDR